MYSSLLYCPYVHPVDVRVVLKQRDSGFLCERTQVGFFFHVKKKTKNKGFNFHARSWVVRLGAVGLKTTNVHLRICQPSWKTWTGGIKQFNQVALLDFSKMFRQNGSNCDRNCPPFYCHFFLICKLGKSLKQGALPSSSSSSSSSSSMFLLKPTLDTATFCTRVRKCCSCFWPHTSRNNVFTGQYPINVIYNININTHFSSLKALLRWRLATFTHLLHLAPGNYSDGRPNETHRYINKLVWGNVSTRV